MDADDSVAEMLDEIPSSLHDCVLELLEHDGWTVGMQPDRPADVRRRLLAQHASGPLLLAVTRPTRHAGGRETKWRGRNNRYFVRQKPDAPWYRVDGFQAAVAFMRTREVDADHTQEYGGADPLDTPNVRNRRVCSCAKRQFSQAKADRALVEAKVKRALRGNQRRRESRSYRCEDDSRVWHLTSRESWRA